MLNERNNNENFEGFEVGDEEMPPVTPFDRNKLLGVKEVEFEDEQDPYDIAIDDMDFSSIEGKDFKSSFKKANQVVTKRATKISSRKKKAFKPLTKKFGVKKKATIEGPYEKKIGKVLVPTDRKVIIQGVDKFIFTEDYDDVKNPNMHDGRELKTVVFTVQNDSEIDFILQLFNPSQPLEYLYSTSQNLNNKVKVGGGEILYSDLLFNILANPMMIYNAKFTFTGPNTTSQIAQPLKFINKSSMAYLKVEPVNLSLQIDPYQFIQDIVTFRINNVLNRPFVPDGMDVIQYTILPHTTVRMAFFYDQIQIKRVMYEEAANSKKLM